MSYDAFLEGLSGDVDGLAPRPKAAIFWLFGSGLLFGLEPQEEWAEWFVSARRLGYEYITRGAVDPVAAAVRTNPGDLSVDSSQLMESTVACFTIPLEISRDPTLAAGKWTHYALSPTMQSLSVELFDDVAFPDDDDDLDIVFAHPRMQLAVEYCQMTVARLAATPSPDAALLDELLDGAGVLAPAAQPEM